jgi:uncharacterized membrane protein
MRFLDRLLGALPFIFGAIIIAGIVHILSILAMPRLAPRDAYARIAEAAPLARMTLLAPIEPGKEFAPFEDPATAAAACRYDLDRGPLRLRGPVSGEGLVALSFHGRFGDVFYSVTDRSAARNGLDILLVTADQLAAIEAYDSEDELPSELRLVAPEKLGFVILRALADQPGDMEAARARLQAIACGVEASAPG